MGRMAREAYFGGRDGNNLYYFPRFNLSDFTKVWNGSAYVDIPDTNSKGGWYQRFTNKNQNDEDARKELDNDTDYLDDFLDKYLAYVPSKDKSHYYSDSYIRDTDCTKPIGLPFLRRIGNNGEKGAFDTVANLRKQIAANLNDYCDSDSIPTSDVDPATWKTVVENNGTAPRYTGNEKTPYINEIALGINLTNAKFDGGKFTVAVNAEVIAELIRIYKEIPAAIGNFKMHGYFKKLELPLEVSFKGSASVTYDNGGTPATKTVNINTAVTNKKEDGGVISYIGNFTVLENSPFTVDFASGVIGSGPYWVKNSSTMNKTVEIDFTDEIKKLDPDLSGKTVNSISISPTDISVKLLNVSFDLTNLALIQNDTTVTPSVERGVDFVKFNAPESGAAHKIELNKEITADSESSLSTATGADKVIYHVGVMQAIDPRQNLFANYKETPDKYSDWVKKVEPSMTIADSANWKWDDFASRITAGAVNAHSNPSAPLYADSSEMRPAGGDVLCDVETATDPVWQGIEVDKHISTAVIRNAPMRSPWELGFIHRGIPFQTINLKKAGGIEFNSASAVFAVIDDNAHDPVNFSGWENANGTSYLNGDAGILDQIKMTEYNKSYGKLDFSALKSTPANMIDAFGELGVSKLAVFKGLFENIKYHKPFEFISSSTSSTWAALDEGKIADTYVAGDAIGTNPATAALLEGIPETRLRSKALVGTDALETALTDRPEQKNDAAQEELVGKTINLTEGISASLPQVFKIVVVAQTIRDLKGDISRFNKHNKPVMAKSSEGLGASTEAVIGKFDAKIDFDDSENSIYFDEILSECRMLVTVEKIHYMDGNNPRARLRVKQIEYLD